MKLNLLTFLEDQEQTPDNPPITKTELDALEKILDRLYGQLGMDIEFTKHFLDRVNDPRNKTQITAPELATLFAKEFKQYGEKLSKLPDNEEGLLTDLKSDINSPFVVHYNSRTSEVELVMKTIMRKKGFKTLGKEYKVR